MAKTATLKRLRVYPVKGMDGMEVDAWELDAYGLRMDSRWMVVDQTGRCITRREHPALAQMRAEIEEDRLILSTPHQPSVTLAAEPESGPTEPARLGDESVVVQDVSEDANRWISQELRTACRLVYLPLPWSRTVDPALGERKASLALQDELPLQLLTTSSLADLARRAGDGVTVEALSPNLVIDDRGEPYADDEWRRIRVGEIELEVLRPWGHRGEGGSNGAPDPAYVRALDGYRVLDGQPRFGWLALHATTTGTLVVGASVEVLERGEAPSFGDAASAPEAAPAEAGGEAAPANTEASEPVEAPPAEEAPAEEAPAEAPPVEKPSAAPRKRKVRRIEVRAPKETDPEEFEPLVSLEEEVGSPDADGEAPPATEPAPAEEPAEVEEAAQGEEPAPPAEPASAEPAEEPAPPAEPEPAEEPAPPAEPEPAEEAEEDPAPPAEPEAPVEPEPAPVAEPASSPAPAEPPPPAEPAPPEEPAAPPALEVSADRRPPADQVARLLVAASLAESAEDAAPLAEACIGATTLVTAWEGEALVGLMRGWTDGFRDGFIADVAVDPDHLAGGAAVDLVRKAVALNPGVRWVLRASAGSAYLGSALGWRHMGSGWYLSPR